MEQLATCSFRNLERRIVQLEDRFTPTLSPTGFYKEKQYDYVRAYIVLTHAEMEEYLEVRARDICSDFDSVLEGKRRSK